MVEITARKDLTTDEIEDLKLSIKAERIAINWFSGSTDQQREAVKEFVEGLR